MEELTESTKKITIKDKPKYNPKNKPKYKPKDNLYISHFPFLIKNALYAIVNS